jgi:hypothetical protein
VSVSASCNEPAYDDAEPFVYTNYPAERFHSIPHFLAQSATRPHSKTQARLSYLWLPQRNHHRPGQSPCSPFPLFHPSHPFWRTAPFGTRWHENVPVHVASIHMQTRGRRKSLPSRPSLPFAGNARYAVALTHARTKRADIGLCRTRHTHPSALVFAYARTGAVESGPARRGG